MRPKYSIILPTLNGRETLSVTLPAMLAIDRDDVEWVISENHSDDGTYDFLRRISTDDERVKLVRPPQRLPIGKHLEFAYQQASGRWLSHLGDDDSILPWRFDLLDQIIDRGGERCGLIRGEYVRYSWPEFPERSSANSIDAATFTNTCELVEGKHFAGKLLNQSHVHGGGAWVVRHDIVAAVRKRCGYFASPQHVEFFAMRAAAALCDQAALVGLPLFILGRHSKSSGTQYFQPKRIIQNQTWDWAFEDPDAYRHSPFNWKSYSTLSLDAALSVQNALAPELASVGIDWRKWSKTIHSEMLKLIRFKQLPAQARRDFLDVISSVPAGSKLGWRWRTFRLDWLSGAKQAQSDAKTSVEVAPGQVVLPQISGGQVGIKSISDLAGWLASETHSQLLSLNG